MKEWKGTKGECKISESSEYETCINTKTHRICEVKHYTDVIIEGLKEPTKEEGEAHANLFVDAFNTMNKCGIMPSELFEQRNELFRRLEQINMDLEILRKNLLFESERLENTRFDGYDNVIESWIEANKKAISKCTGK